MTDGEERDPKSDLDRALEELLVGEVRVKVDPATGQVIATSDGEKSSLTDAEDAPTIA
jgi:hypothetical protein